MTTRVDDTHPAGSSQLGGALTRFRFAAFATGIGLLGMVVVMVIRYGFDNPTPSAVWSPLHGGVYMIYMALTVDLAIKARWSVVGTLLVLLAGCVPVVSFIGEHKVTRRVQAGQRV